MTSKEALREIITATLKYLPDSVIEKNSKLSNIVLQDLEHLETLERNSNKVIMDSIKVINRNLELQAENEKLKKALEKACKILSWDCPCCQDLIDDLDCENRCQPDIDYAECWKKYFLREVLGE